MTPNAQFILELLEIVLNGACMKFQKEFFMQIMGIVMQIMGIVMGTNLAPVLANIYGYGKRAYGLKSLKDSSMTDLESLKATKNNF